MNYTIIFDGKVWFTNFYDYQLHYIKSMIIINNTLSSYSIDGKKFNEIKFESNE